MGFRQLLLTALAVAFPAGVVFTVLAAMEQLGWGTAVLGAMLPWLGVAAKLRISFDDLRRVAKSAS